MGSSSPSSSASVIHDVSDTDLDAMLFGDTPSMQTPRARAGSAVSSGAPRELSRQAQQAARSRDVETRP
ncbi:MAG: hypothetical protein ABW073_06650, partial [Acidimicrobiia bacterium]